MRLYVFLAGIITTPGSLAYVVPTVELSPPPPPPPLPLQRPSKVMTTHTHSTETSSAPWRLALNLGRELTTPLWDSFGSSGIRFPIVVPCSFLDDGTVQPLTDQISYVANVHGAETKPVESGTWSLRGNDDNNNDDDGDHHHHHHHQTLEFTLSFPQELQKKDVIIPGGSTLVMEGTIMTQQALKRLQQAFSDARVEEWKALEQIDQLHAIRNSPKRWNEERQRWETPTIEEPLTSLLQKHWNAFVKGQERRKRFQEKPRSGVELSKQPGHFPTMDDYVYFGTRGIIRNRNRGGMIVGTWAAEPMIGVSTSHVTNQ